MATLGKAYSLTRFLCLSVTYASPQLSLRFRLSKSVELLCRTSDDAVIVCLGLAQQHEDVVPQKGKQVQVGYSASGSQL